MKKTIVTGRLVEACNLIRNFQFIGQNLLVRPSPPSFYQQYQIRLGHAAADSATAGSSNDEMDLDGYRKPKRYRYPFAMFMRRNYRRISAQNPGASSRKIMKFMSEAYWNLTPEEKEEYEKESREDVNRYYHEMRALPEAVRQVFEEIDQRRGRALSKGTQPPKRPPTDGSTLGAHRHLPDDYIPNVKLSGDYKMPKYFQSPFHKFLLESVEKQQGGDEPERHWLRRAAEQFDALPIGKIRALQADVNSYQRDLDDWKYRMIVDGYENVLNLLFPENMKDFTMPKKRRVMRKKKKQTAAAAAATGGGLGFEDGRRPVTATSKKLKPAAADISKPTPTKAQPTTITETDTREYFLKNAEELNEGQFSSQLNQATIETLLRATKQYKVSRENPPVECGTDSPSMQANKPGAEQQHVDHEEVDETEPEAKEELIGNL